MGVIRLQGWGLLNGTRVPMGRDSVLALPLPPRENTRGSGQCETWKRAPPGTQPCWRLDLGLPACRTVGNTVLLLDAPPVCGTLL